MNTIINSGSFPRSPNRSFVGRLSYGRMYAGLAFVLGILVGVSNTSAWQVDQQIDKTPGAVNTNALLDMLGQAYLTLESHHYAPPTGQQFALTAARVIRTYSGRASDRSMKSEVEELATADDLRKWLTKEVEMAKQSKSEMDPELIVNQTVRQFDPGAMVISNKEARLQDQLRDNRYVGIGIRIRYSDGFAIIDEPFPGGAARKAGAKAGDIILKVNDQSMEGHDLDHVIDVLRGEIDTPVFIVVRNEKESDSRRLEMIRAVVPIPSVQGVSQNDDGSWEFFDPGKEKTAMLKLTGIVGSTASELADAARKIRLGGLKNVVLDMRQVTDCDLHYAQMVADTLTGADRFATVIDGEGKSQDLNTRDECEFDSFRVAVLVPEKVSGPVMAVICRLNSSPNMITIGTHVQSDLQVSGAFDFPDGSGSISGMQFARIDAASLNLKGNTELANDVVMGRALLSDSPAVVLNTGIAVEKSEGNSPKKAALAWLAENGT